jgi:Family of unknown function (DUF6922)
MGVIIKKIGNREYAYLVIREGKRVVHKYIGPAGSPQAMQKLQEKIETTAVPPRFRSLFWDTSIDKIHIKRNARYIMERVLELGDMDAIEWLQRVYPARHIIDVLYLSRPLTEKSRNFWMLWFGVGTA